MPTPKWQLKLSLKFETMIYKAVIIWVLLLCLGGPSHSQASMSIAPLPTARTGVGIMIIDPAALTLRHFLDKNNSVDVALSWGSQWFYAHSDYLFQQSNVFKNRKFPLSLHYGAGLRFISFEDRYRDMFHPRDHYDRHYSSIGARLPIGLSLFTKNPSLEFFGELAGIVDITPSLGIGISAAIGVRIYLF